jgi:hypothetical protein
MAIIVWVERGAKLAQVLAQCCKQNVIEDPDTLHIVIIS